jgi:hypothetical protein
VADVNRIQRGDLQQRLAQLLRIYGEPSPAPTLAPEMQAVVLVENLESQSLSINPTNRRYSSATDLAAGGAGNEAMFSLSNPAGSGIIARVDAMNLGSPLVAQIFYIGRISVIGNVPSGTLPEYAHDTRGPGAACQATAGVQLNGGAAFLDQQFQIAQCPVATSFDAFPTFDRFGVVIKEGENFSCGAVVANARALWSITWTEFQAT